MDEQIRKLERLTSLGDAEAENKLYRFIIRSGTKELENILSRHPRLLERHYLEAKEANKLVKYGDFELFPDQLTGLYKLADQFKQQLHLIDQTPIDYVSSCIKIKLGVITSFDLTRAIADPSASDYAPHDELIFPKEFIFLKELMFRNVRYNQKPVKELDINSCINLEKITCSSIKTRNLDFSNNPKLKFVTLKHMKLDNIKFQTNTLVELDCKHCSLIELDLKEQNKLEYLDCSYNDILDLDVSNYPNLKILECYHNRLINLNLKNQLKLEELGCHENNLRELDLNDCENLKSICCRDNLLTKLDLRNNNKLEHYDIFGNRYLETQFPAHMDWLNHKIKKS